MAQKTSFYVSDEFDSIYKKYVTRYGSPSKAITGTMLGLDEIYRTERRALRDLFTQQEINLMLNHALSTDYYYYPRHTTGVILGNALDEIQATFDYFEVDRDALINKLRSITVSQDYALVDWLMEMRGNSSSVCITIKNLKDWLDFDGISEARAAEVCGTSIEVVQQWIANPAAIPQDAVKKLEMEKMRPKPPSHYKK